ncbi:biopolymer transporter ExbD [Spirulina sp. CCNP1310]|uniref:ExbD/TolR family protein n=1 Tax=Spirulina sp. CCNP1310 TaxID=3110249 RepID=UPI002B21305F|nr:biopolymer transporter ExbD [Spirulina sp. CCNP1310]MEA5418418.1 biopolymer transporter ExbD [Spirulina sp. CCNP1310]
MAFRKRARPTATIPQVNLVPMMDVLMSVLTFFIITSMSLTGERIDRVTLPGNPGENGTTAIPEDIRQLMIGFTADEQIVLDGQVLTEAELLAAIENFLAEDETGVIVLNADRTLPYEKIAALLNIMGQIGGDRVSLAIQRQ